MSCKFDTILLQDYVEGTIEPLEKVFVEEHLRTCLNCRRELSVIKLLFWELEGIKKCELDVPPEVEDIRKRALDSIFASTGKGRLGLKELIKIQKHILLKYGIFVEFIPGVKKGEEFIRKGIKKVPMVLSKASLRLLKGGYKIMQMRFQT